MCDLGHLVHNKQMSLESEAAEKGVTLVLLSSANYLDTVRLLWLKFLFSVVWRLGTVGGLG